MATGLGLKDRIVPGSLERKWGMPGILAGAIVLAAIPFWVKGYEVTFLADILALSLFALSLDITWGRLGMYNLGHAAYFGTGGYVAALLATRLYYTNIVGLVAAGALAGGLLGLLVATFLFAGRKPLAPTYSALMTLSLAFILERAAHSMSWLGADTGIPGIPFPTLGRFELSEGLHFYIVNAALVLAVILALHFLTCSPIGLVLNALREDEQRLGLLGYRLGAVRIPLYTASATLASASGVLYTLHAGFISPGALGVALSTEVVVWTLLGGSGTLFGPVLGVAGLEYASRFLSDRLGGWWQLAVGILLLLVVLVIPGGLVSIARHLYRRGGDLG